MNEILIVLLLLIIAGFMFGSIMLIIKADRKINEINNNVEKIKTINFEQLKKIVSTLKKINAYIRLDKLKQIFEISMTTLSAINLIYLIKKIQAKQKKQNI